MTPAQAPAVELADVHKSFGAVRAVAGVSLRITAGEVVALLGPNGAGKTTTVDLMLGLVTPDSGAVRLFGQSPQRCIAQGRIAAVLQTGGLLKDLTVADTVRLTASLFTVTRPVAEVLERAGLSALAQRRVGQCSGGEQQLLRFALALLPDPQLLLLDEPTTGMDVAGRRDFWTAIRADAAGGRTIVFATHYLEEADAFADRIVLMAGGQVVADGSATQVRALAAGRVVSATWPGADLAALRALAGVASAQAQGDRITVHTAPEGSDALARFLLTETSATEVEIASRNLEEAFLALTAAPSSRAGQR